MKLFDIKNLDKKSKIELAVVGFLALILIFSFSGAIKKVISKVKPAQAPVTDDAKKALGLIQEKRAREAEKKTSLETIEKRKELEKEMEWGRDPFHEEAIGGGSSVTIELQGITWQGKNSKAIISNQVVGVGDRIGKNRVVEIHRSYVVLNDGTENFTLHLD